MSAGLGDCMTLAKNVRALGVPLSSTLADVLDTYVALRDAFDENPAADLTAAIGNGSMTPANAAKMLQQAASRAGAKAQGRDLVTALQRPLAKRFTADLLGQGGALIIEALRPSFDAAAAAIADNEIGPAPPPTRCSTWDRRPPTPGARCRGIDTLSTRS